MKGFLIIVFLVVFAATAQAQLRDDSIDASGNPRNQQIPSNSPAEEMRYRAAVRQEEENHQETVDRADEISQLGSEIRKTLEGSPTLDRETLKRLERIEKLARKVRGSAGGSDADKVPLDPPATLDASLARLAELSEQINRCVKKTSRMVVSATVIERSNEMIQLIKYIRTFAQP